MEARINSVLPIHARVIPEAFDSDYEYMWGLQPPGLYIVKDEFGSWKLIGWDGKTVESFVWSSSEVIANLANNAADNMLVRLANKFEDVR